MEQLYSLYTTYVTPIFWIALGIMVVVTLIIFIRFLSNFNKLSQEIDETFDVVQQIDEGLNMTLTKKRVLTNYYKKKRSQFRKLLTALFFIRSLSDEN